MEGSGNSDELCIQEAYKKTDNEPSGGRTKELLGNGIGTDAGERSFQFHVHCYGLQCIPSNGKVKSVEFEWVLQITHVPSSHFKLGLKIYLENRKKTLTNTYIKFEQMLLLVSNLDMNF